MMNSDGEKFSFHDIIGENGSLIEGFEKKEEVMMLAECIEKLDDNERAVLEMYYWDELTLKEIGAVLGISESRVCQVHTRLIIKLRAGMAKKRSER